MMRRLLELTSMDCVGVSNETVDMVDKFYTVNGCLKSTFYTVNGCLILVLFKHPFTV